MQGICYCCSALTLEHNLERTLCLIILGLALLGLTSITSKASELDFFDEFESDSKSKVDIIVDSLDFVRPETGAGKSGTFKFKKFHFVSPNSSVFLENQNNIFDSVVYIKDKFIGVKGPSARFSYNLAQVDAEYLHTFSWVKLRSTRLLMEEEQISLSGEYYQIRKPKTILALENFTWDCDRHPDYLENNSNGFLAGCLNLAGIKPIEDSRGISVSYQFIEENKTQNEIAFNSNITEVLMGQDSFKGHSNTSELIFDNGVKLISSDMTVECEKQRDLIEITSETVVTPCLTNLEMNSDLFAIVDRSTVERDYKFTKALISLSQDEILVSADQLRFASEEVSFDLDHGRLVTKKMKDFDTQKFSDYLVSWYNSSKLIPLKPSSPMKMAFKINGVNPKTKQKTDMKISSFLKGLEATEETIVFDSENFVIDQNNEYLYKFKTLQVECSKKLIGEDFNMEEVLKDCKSSGRFKFPRLVIDNKVDPKKSKYFLKSEYLKVEDGFMSILAPGLQLVDKETNITLFNSSLKCRKNYENDLFDILDVIEDCFEGSSAFINKIVSEKNKKRSETKNIYSLYTKLLNGSDFDPISLIREKDAFVKDIRLDIKKNWMKLNLEIKFLGANLKISAEGKISLDRSRELITVDIQKAKLPLTKSKKILMYFLKKNLASEKIYFENGLIKIIL